MALDALAPDQRAVVQLVLQQERSYDDLAGLLGISSEAVRDRAHAGLERLGGTGGDLTPEERGEIADYLLGQQSVSRRESVRELMRSSADAREWAQSVAAQLSEVAGTPLPEVPTAEPVAASVVEREAATEADVRPEPAEVGIATAPVAREVPPVRPRPRPRTAPAPRRPPREGSRSSRLGGALLIAGIAILLAAVIVWLVAGGDDDEEPAGNNAGTATPTATATPGIEAVGQIPLEAPGDGEARGAMTIFASQEGQIAFTIEAENVPQSREGEAYAVWLIGGDKPRWLGFAPTVGEDGRLGTSGPRDNDAERFVRWLQDANQVVISRETTENATQPGPIVLAGTIPQQAAGGGG